jgi:hypothetical protein
MVFIPDMSLLPDINNKNYNRVMSKKMVLTLMAGLIVFSLVGVYAASTSYGSYTEHEDYGSHRIHEQFDGEVIAMENSVANGVPVVYADVMMTDGIVHITLGSQDYIEHMGLREGDHVSLSGFRTYNGTFIPETLHMGRRMLPIGYHEQAYGIYCEHHQSWE